MHSIANSIILILSYSKNCLIFAYSESKLTSYFVVVVVGVVGVVVGVVVVGRKVEKVGKRSEDIIGRS